MMIFGGESKDATNLQILMYAQCRVALSSALMWFHANLMMSFLNSLNNGKRCSRNRVDICDAEKDM